MSQPAAIQFASPNLQLGKAPPAGLVPVGLKRSVSVGYAVHKEWSGSASWEVNELEPVPMDFPLERTHREIHGVDAKEVAARISNALRLLSIEAEYDGENAKAKCRTSDLVSFRIRLFAGGEGGLPVMVEVQRRSGSPSSFMRSCRAILDAAEGAEICAEKVASRKKLPPFMKGPVGSMKCLQAVPLKTSAEDDMNAGLKKATEMLRCKEKDSNLLGLESLCHLTDALKTRPDIATNVSKQVIIGEDASDVREEVAVMLQTDVFSPEDVDSEDAPTTIIEKSRHLALVVFSNSLALTSKDGCLADAVKSQKWFSDFLIPSLLDEVKSFEKSANNSYEAVCGLTSLATCSDVARRLMEEHADDLKAAHLYGKEFHELLANEAERCLSHLGISI